MTQLTPTTYIDWLLQSTHPFIEAEALLHGREQAWERLIAFQIFEDCLKRNSLAFSLILATGDKEFTEETFRKAARMILPTGVRK